MKKSCTYYELGIRSYTRVGVSRELMISKGYGLKELPTSRWRVA